MNDCCIDVVDGVAAGGGGGAVVTQNQWTCVYEVDFRDAFASLGATDLNSLGSSFAFEGITWLTPTIARSGADMVTTAVSFGLTANGLEVVDAVGGGFTNPFTVASIFASLEDIAANSATPFEPDSTRNYLFQCYVSAFTPTGNTDEIAVMLFKQAGLPPGSSAASAIATLSQNAGVVDTPTYLAGSGGGALARHVRSDLPPTVYNVPTVHYIGTGHAVNGYTGIFAGGDWPANEDLAFISSWAANTETTQSLVGDPTFTLAGVGFDSDGGTVMSGVVERFRVCQF